MKLPAKNSRAMQVLQVLRCCAMVTVQEGVEKHGQIGKNLDDATAMYEELVARGCLERHGARYCVTEDLLDLYEPKREAAQKPVVPPRTVPPFRPLSARFRVSSRGLREGSNDLAGVPSAYAKLERN